MDTPFESEIEAMIAESEPKAASGDAQSLYDVAMLHHDLAIRRQSWEHFASAESRLRAAAGLGLPAAIEMLNNWETLRHALNRRIARNSAA
jgi:hypothetical protein